MSIYDRLHAIATECGLPVKKLVDAILQQKETNDMDFQPPMVQVAPRFSITLENGDELIFADLGISASVSTHPEIYVEHRSRTVASNVLRLPPETFRRLGDWFIARSIK